MRYTTTLLPLSLAALAAADPIHIPLTRRSVRRDGIERFAAAADHVRAKYGYPTVSSNLRRRAKTAGIDIINQDADSSYIGTVTIGTPSQSFPVVLDTGSSDLWLATTSCTSCPDQTPEFNPSSSSTLVQNNTSGQNSEIEIQYGSGAVKGTLASDTVSMAGFTVDSQTLLLVSDVTSGLLGGNVSGILGLAFEALASTQATPFWEALVNDKQMSSPEISFWLTRFIDDADATPEEPGGVFTLGGTNSTLYTGSIEFQSLVDSSSPTFWMLDVSSVTVQGKSVSIPTGSSAQAAIDTGTTLIGGPSEAVKNVYAAIPGSQALSGQYNGFYAFPCSTTVNVSMAFGGSSWPISPEDMNLGPMQEGSNYCVGGIFDLDLGSDVSSGNGNPSWVVGDTFLKNVYSVFRASPAAVGFAQLSEAAGGSSGTPSGSVGSATLTGTNVPTSSTSSTSSTPSASGTSTTTASSTSSHSSASRVANTGAVSLGIILSIAASTLSGWFVLA
ncbi:acid protease [Wolfiporia cocos MD-104 SS10]|uniref:Acid protease n=1 Tax=Wolfiporia cocos (strain MD-104) TaxID=742152 RepID=A0A2H3J2R0_WOLCO|nr:acid protease [Wolfiporia cocos MD-104 SS10]